MFHCAWTQQICRVVSYPPADGSKNRQESLLEGKIRTPCPPNLNGSIIHRIVYHHLPHGARLSSPDLPGKKTPSAAQGSAWGDDRLCLGIVPLTGERLGVGLLGPCSVQCIGQAFPLSTPWLHAWMSQRTSTTFVVMFSGSKQGRFLGAGHHQFEYDRT